jgi:hypothetical protein
MGCGRTGAAARALLIARVSVAPTTSPMLLLPFHFDCAMDATFSYSMPRFTGSVCGEARTISNTCAC